jgi:plastocyanin
MLERCTTTVVATALMLVAAAVLTFAVVPGASASTPDATAARKTVIIKGFKFSPSKFTVKAGTTLVVKNKDGATHNLAALNGAFDTGDIEGGSTGKVTVEKPGTYRFDCTIHPYMTGTIKVK